MAAIRKKLAVVGENDSGMVRLLYRFVNKPFTEKYMPTVFERHVADIALDGKQVELDLINTAGMSKYKNMIPNELDNPDVLLLCIHSSENLTQVQGEWCPKINKWFPTVPLILLRIKDLGDDEMEEGPDWPEARAMAEQINAYRYMECSLRRNSEVKEVFEIAARAALQH